MVCSRAADAEESEERASARSTDRKCNILRVADRDPVARFARTLRPVHECVQSVQPLVSARSLEAYFRCSGGKIARQFVLDR
jgi:transposase